MKARILVILLLGAMLVAGCTSAGPYVTDIAYDGEGNLMVTKNTVKFNWFFGTVHTGENEQTIVIKTPKYGAILDDKKLVGYCGSRDPATGKPVTTPIYEDIKK